MPFARCSSLDRLLACSGGSVLPNGPDHRSESTKIAGNWGDMVHHWKETGEIIVPSGRSNLPPLFEKKLRESGVRREEYWPDALGITHESAIAIDPLRRYGLYEGPDTKEAKEAWKAAHDDDWCTGTVDGHWRLFDGLTIEDLKTGRMVSFEDYECQVMSYGLGIARVLDYRGPVHLLLCHWSRYPVCNKPIRFGRVVEQDELLAFEKRLLRLRDDVRRITEARLTVGSHCLYCPAKGSCPEFNGGS